MGESFIAIDPCPYPFDHLGIGEAVAVQHQLRLLVTGRSLGHVALHEIDELPVAQPAQLRPLGPSVGVSREAILSAERRR